MRTRKRRLSGPPYNKRRKFREFFFFSLACLVGPRQRGEEGEKSWTTNGTPGNERYYIPNVQDLRISATTEVTTKANEPIRQSPIRQDISSTKRGERGDK